MGLMIAHIILGAMESITERLVGIPDKSDWNNVTCQLMRGLFGQLLSLYGSGQNYFSLSCPLFFPRTLFFPVFFLPCVNFLFTPN